MKKTLQDPYQAISTTTYRLSIPPEEVWMQVKAETDQLSALQRFLPSSGGGKASVWRTGGSREQFSLLRKWQARGTVNAFAPVLHARVEPEGAGSTVAVSFAVERSVSVFFRFFSGMLLFSTLLVGWSLVRGLISNQPAPGTAAGVLVIAVLWLALFGFWKLGINSGEGDIAALTAFVETLFDGHRIS